MFVDWTKISKYLNSINVLYHKIIKIMATFTQSYEYKTLV